MNTEYNQKRINPPIWQHDYHVLSRLFTQIQYLIGKYCQRKMIIVDYGCGSSPYQHLFHLISQKYLKVDIGKNPQADILIDEKEKLPVEDSSIDLVLSTQVLEHVVDTDFYLSECTRMLKKRGILMLSTHGLWPYHPYPEDYQRWTRRGLRDLIKKHQFKIIYSYSVLGPFASITQFTSLILAEKFAYSTIIKRLLLALFSLVANGIIYFEDMLFPATRTSDSSLYLICVEKI